MIAEARDNAGNAKQATQIEVSPYLSTTEWAYGYTGGSQSFTAPVTGRYQLEAYGAQGGHGGGAGGFVQGQVDLGAGQVLNIEVGGTPWEGAYGGYNGGGSGQYGGGGASTISTVGITIMTGAGGGGGTAGGTIDYTNWLGGQVGVTGGSGGSPSGGAGYNGGGGGSGYNTVASYWCPSGGTPSYDMCTGERYWFYFGVCRPNREGGSICDNALDRSLCSCPAGYNAVAQSHCVMRPPCSVADPYNYPYSYTDYQGHCECRWNGNYPATPESYSYGSSGYGGANYISGAHVIGTASLAGQKAGDGYVRINFLY